MEYFLIVYFVFIILFFIAPDLRKIFSVFYAHQLFPQKYYFTFGSFCKNLYLANHFSFDLISKYIYNFYINFPNLFLFIPQIITMNDQIIRSTSFRTHKKYQSNLQPRNIDSFVKTKYNQSFGQLFIKKNKDRFAHLKRPNYFKQTSQLSFVNQSKLQYNQGSPILNHAMSMPDKVKSISQLQPKLMGSTNKSSYRSNVMNIDLHKPYLPKLRTNSTSNFNSFSHSKLQSLTYLMSQINQESIVLGIQTKETSFLIKRISNQLQKESNQSIKNLELKINKLQKFVQETKFECKNRKQNIESDIPILQTQTAMLKKDLDKIQQKINIIQHSIGYTTGHHKHFI